MYGGCWIPQARWRGSRQRRRAGKSAAAAARRLRKALASGVDPRATLAARTAAALHVLQQCFHVSQAGHDPLTCHSCPALWETVEPPHSLGA